MHRPRNDASGQRSCQRSRSPRRETSHTRLRRTTLQPPQAPKDRHGQPTQRTQPQQPQDQCSRRLNHPVQHNPRRHLHIPMPPHKQRRQLPHPARRPVPRHFRQKEKPHRVLSRAQCQPPLPRPDPKPPPAITLPSTLADRPVPPAATPTVPASQNEPPAPPPEKAPPQTNSASTKACATQKEREHEYGHSWALL